MYTSYNIPESLSSVNCLPLEARRLWLVALAKHTEAGVLYFNNPGNRPAGYTCQVLDPRSLGISQNTSRTLVAVTAQVIRAQGRRCA